MSKPQITKSTHGLIAMRGLKYFLLATWRTKLLICFPVVVLVACSSVAKSTELSDWPELSFFVDAFIEIQLQVPRSKIENVSPDLQFIGIKDESLTRLFMVGYDIGKGRYREIPMIYLSGTIARLKRENDSEAGLSLEDIKNRIYLSRPDAAEDFDFAGEQVVAGRSWLRINLIGGTQRRGVSYASPINDEYVLILSMTMYGEKSNKTRLYRDRHEDLKSVLKSVRIVDD